MLAAGPGLGRQFAGVRRRRGPRGGHHRDPRAGEGLLGSDIIGFQTRLHCNNFLDSAARLECRVDREDIAVVQRGRASLVRAYPISIDWPCRWAETALPVEVCRQEVWRELELPAQAVLGVGVDRLDYTKGIEERLLAVEGALERDESLRGRLVFAQLAAPSRSVLPQYRALDERVQALSERINARFGSPGYRPILLLRASHPPERVFRFYRAAAYACVSSLDDGMHLVAKEFVAARTGWVRNRSTAGLGLSIESTPYSMPRAELHASRNSVSAWSDAHASTSALGGGSRFAGLFFSFFSPSRVVPCFSLLTTRSTSASSSTSTGTSSSAS